MRNFRAYLVSRRPAKTPAGEFARQLRDDPETEKIEAWPQLQAYLYRKTREDKIKEAIAAAEPLWKGYRAFVLKQRREQYHKRSQYMGKPKDQQNSRESKSPPRIPPRKQSEKGKSGDPDNPSETTGATESGEEDIGAKA